MQIVDERTLKMANRILVLHGPNMNLLGDRDTVLYGFETIEEVNSSISAAAADLGVETMIEQRNSEGELIDLIHHHCTGDLSSPGKVQGLIINPAAYSHYSYAIRDALEVLTIPVVEVHMTNVVSRKDNFRHNLVTASVSKAVISGFGADSYILALSGMSKLLSST